MNRHREWLITSAAIKWLREPTDNNKTSYNWTASIFRLPFSMKEVGLFWKCASVPLSRRHALAQVCLRNIRSQSHEWLVCDCTLAWCLALDERAAVGAPYSYSAIYGRNHCEVETLFFPPSRALAVFEHYNYFNTRSMCPSIQLNSSLVNFVWLFRVWLAFEC